MRFFATCYENVTRGSRFFAVNPGDAFQIVNMFIVDADDVDEALNKLWSIGNKMEPDSVGHNWPNKRRSMCVADIIVIRTDETTGQWYEIKSMGFEPISGMKYTDHGNIVFKH